MSESPNQHQHVGHVDAVNLTVSLCLCYTICIALVRLWIRRGAFGVDDLVVLVATLVTLSHTGSSYAALADGLGKPWIDIKALKDLSTFTVALYISKIGVLAFLGRITKNRTQVLGYYVCCALVATFGVMSVLIVTVGCSSPSGYYWAFYENSARCDSQVSEKRPSRNMNSNTNSEPPSPSAGKSSQPSISSLSSACSLFPSNSSGACKCPGPRSPSY